MKEEIDKHTGQKRIVHTPEEIKMGFLAECVEGLADVLGCKYTEAFNRLETADMTQNYILQYYDTLHTESFETIMEGLEKLLLKREQNG